MIFEFIILMMGVPVGYLIAYLARDELIAGKKWFRALIVLGIIFGLLLFLIRFYAGAWTSWFIVIVSLMSFIKSNDKRWIKWKR